MKVCYRVNVSSSQIHDESTVSTWLGPTPRDVGDVHDLAGLLASGLEAANLSWR